uniref:RIMS-binding protein 2 n=1 Tax=Sinocyclocheilus rhinocerous TaxID=307959 RepID=A0A673JSK6_9TELE
MREVAERRQQLELEHEQALAILKFKQDEIKRLQRAKVRELEEKCRSQSEQFGMLSQELDKFRVQASKIDLSGPDLLSSPSLTQLTNGVGLSSETGMLKYYPTDNRSFCILSDLKFVLLSKCSYNPYDGPNDNPEVELPLTAGEYIYVYGDMDDDGFYEGELMDGRRGLVPSNFVERMSDDDFMSSHPHQASDMSHNSFQESSFHSGSERLHQHHLPNPSNPALAAPLTNGLDLDLEEVGVDTVPYPRKLTLIKQLAMSIIIGWESPLVPAGWGSVFSYNVYVDHELRFNVPFGTQTKAVLERLDLAQKAYRIAVQCLTERGNSDQLRCSILVGRDVCVAPTHLHVERITATSASLTWLPSNSNYVHIVSLNDEECELVKAGCYSLCLSNLTPNMHYNIKVEARPHRTAWELMPECRERKTAVTSFTTLTAGPPDAPLDVQLEQGPSPGIAQISWLPVTIDAAGTSNGVRVTGYTIYADKKKVLEVSSPTAGSALIGPSQIQTLQAAHELTVRTMSAFGESVDSLPVNVPSKLPAIMSGVSLPQCQSVPATASANPDPAVCATSLSAAKTPILPHAATLDEHTTGPVRGVYVNTPNAVAREAPSSPASYVEAWANPTSAAPLTVAMPAQEALPLYSSRANSTPFMSNIGHPCPSVPENCIEVVFVERYQVYAGGLMDPPPDYHGESSRSDLSDILEEEEEDLLSEPIADVSSRGYSTAPTGRVCTSPEENEVRVFVALFPYDPAVMSPNPDAAEEELPFKEGQIIKVYGDKDADGFYRGEVGSRCGYVPCNMVSEIQVDDEETRDQLLMQGFLSTEASMEKMDLSRSAGSMGSSRPRRMVAIFDYDPRESSPNADIEAELTFSAGDIIYVLGDMDDDGFYYVSFFHTCFSVCLKNKRSPSVHERFSQLMYASSQSEVSVTHAVVNN